LNPGKAHSRSYYKTYFYFLTCSFYFLTIFIYSFMPTKPRDCENLKLFLAVLMSILGGILEI
jgi:hypothetical protein